MSSKRSVVALIAMFALGNAHLADAQTPSGAILQEPFARALDFSIGDRAVLLREESECDPTWDGALFGILPGVGLSFLVAGFRASNRAESNDDLIIWLGAGAGALIGWGVDAARCVPRDAD